MHTGGGEGDWYSNGTSPLREPGTPGLPAGRPGRRPLIVSGALAAAVILVGAAVLGSAQSVTVGGTPLVASPVNPGRVSTAPPAPPTTGTTPTAPPATGTTRPAPPASGTTPPASPGTGTTQPVPSAPGGSAGRSPRNGPSTGGTAVPGPGSGAAAGQPGVATAAQQAGVVDIDTVLGYDDAAAAGTGMVLTPAGVILTNNHVVEGSTRITVAATGQSYPATVVGTDATDDIAVLQLTDASGLSTANLAAAAAVTVGDPVTGVGNAGGAGGTPAAATGTVTATDQTITTQSDGAAAGETLHGLIRTSAAIRAGDSGGPLYNAADQVVGIDTAAEQGRRATIAGYAIPIATALAIADQIQSGHPSPTITLGYPAFLGVQVSAPATTRYRSAPPATVGGAAVSAVISGTPADRAGLTAGDTITGFDGTTIGTAEALTAALAGHTPGQDVTITWIDPAGATHSTSLTLAAGPAA